MKITIQIEDAPIGVLKALASYKDELSITIPKLDDFYGYDNTFSTPSINLTTDTIDISKAKAPTKTATVRLKKDGTPAKKRGRPVGSGKKVKA